MLTEITLGQYYPGTSFVHKLDPRTKLLATMAFIFAIFLATNFAAYAALLVFLLLVINLAQLPLLLVLKSVKPLWVIIVFTMLIHMFSGQGEPIWTWKALSITREGISLGIRMSLRLVLLLMVSSVLTFTTSPIVLTDGIESLLNPFKALGVPAHELAMMMTIALRFIPTLLEETDRIMKAQMARGADFEAGNIMQRGRNMLPILIPLFVSAFRRADELAIAMESRCYRGGEGRTRMHELLYGKRDVLTGVVMLLLLGSMAVLRWGHLCGI